MTYLTYEEYTQKGGTLDSTAFNRYIDRASGIITNATFDRVQFMQEIPAEVKACCRDIVEYLFVNVPRETMVTSRSQSAGNVSESESYQTKTTDDIANDLDDIIYDYLHSVHDDKGTPLLYRGVAK